MHEVARGSQYRLVCAVVAMLGCLSLTSSTHADPAIGTPGDLSAIAPLSFAIDHVEAASLTPLQSTFARIAAFEDDQQATSDSTATNSGRHLRTWELPAMTVSGEAPSALHEEELVGSYHQPRWTATRRFPGTRVYVIPEGKVEVELWARGTFDGGESEWRFLQEVEIGLPHRFQLDVYLRQDYESDSGETQWGGQFEVRWAFADWGDIWGNPTIYLEYVALDGRPDAFEPKLLLGGELAEGWHWGVNIVGEFQLSGEREYEYSLTSALAYSLIDSVLSVGIENILSLTDVQGDRGHYSTSFVMGPSIQWHPVPAMTINIAPLFGVTSESPDMQLWCNFGWEF